MSIYRIVDIVGMARSLREEVFAVHDVGVPHPAIGMDGYVTVEQIVSEISDNAIVHDEEDDEEIAGGLYISDEKINEIEKYVVEQITSSALARLAASGLIDVFVNEDGEMTFERAQEEVCDAD